MRRASLIAALATALFAPIVQGQVLSFYGTYSPAHVSTLTTAIDLVTGTTQYASLWTNGAGFGATARILRLGPATLGLDLRGTPKTGTPAIDTVLVGLKLGARLPLTRLKPYVQVSGGLLSIRNLIATTYPANTVSSSTANENDTAVQFIGGVDYPVRRFLDVRAIELGIGEAQFFNLLGGSGTAPPNHTLFTVNSGFVVHF